MANMHLYALRVLLLCFVPLTSGYTSPDSDYDCKRNCEKESNFANEGGSDLFCDKDCSIKQCYTGCGLYEKAIDTSCQKVCLTSSQQNTSAQTRRGPSQDELRNCVRGCIFALEKYSQQKAYELGALTTPTVVAQSLTHSSVTLRWNTPIVANVTFKLHKKMLDWDSGWHLHTQAKFLRNRRIELTDLQPYVTYKFKVVAMISSLPKYIQESKETLQIATKPYGAPSTAPQIRYVTTPSPTVISLAWYPPRFTNNRLISFKIQLRPMGASAKSQVSTTINDIPANATSWVVSNLQSSLTYTVSLSAINLNGEGPTSSRTVTTPNPGNVSSDEAPYLIFGEKNKITKWNMLDVRKHADNVHALDDSSDIVRDISLHIRRKLIVASTSKGKVVRVSLDGDSIRDDLYPSLRDPGALAVDWLADRVYVASKNRIYSCPLDRDLCVTVVDRLPKTASAVKIDPINGFLFYVLTGPTLGLHRLDLSQISHLWTPRLSPSEVQVHRTKMAKPEQILSMPDLHTVTIDFDSVHLFAVNNSKKAMLTTFLDGTNRRPFRENLKLGSTSAMEDVTSMVYFNRSFIWTNGKRIYFEEIKEGEIFHNNLLFLLDSYSGINVYHHKAQPFPVPSTAPANLQALFTMDRAVIKWDFPPILEYQGEGAWSNWTYELRYQKAGESEVQQFQIAERSFNLVNLSADTVYTVTVRASSQTGHGPWSKPFVSRTLKSDGLKVLMGLHGGEIVLKDISEGSKTTVVNFFSDAKDIDWYEDIVLWVTEDGALSFYNITTRQKRRLNSPKGKVSCLAYDWIGHKVYWSEEEQSIRRSDLTGHISDFVRQVHMANDLAIDAVGGHLYWATPFKIEASRLHGDEHVEIFSIPYYAGPNVISLTLDLDSNKVLWYVRGFESQSVFVTDLLSLSGSLRRPEKLGDFHSVSHSSGLSSFSQRLFWLTESNQLVTGDSHCNYTSSITFASNLTAFSVVHPDLHTYPAGLGLNSIQVVPNPVKSEDIRPDGEYSKFKLKWPPASEVTHGTVFYKVSIIAGSENQSVTTTENWREISGLSPYTQMVVSVQPYTYWGFASATTLSVRSPMSTPTAPLSPDVYITQHKNASTLQQTLAADFHWMKPSLTRGLLHHHYVIYWRGMISESRAVIKKVKLLGMDRRFLLTNLAKSETYQFKVQACTEVGCGPFSETVVRKTDALNPIPTLLVASTDGLSQLKLLTKINSSSILGNIKPESVSFLAQEDDRLFWLDYTNKLCENSDTPFEELSDLNANGKDLTMDWISRTLYTVESGGPGLSSIKQFNIDRRSHRHLLSRPADIGTIAADPYTSSLVWTEVAGSSNGKGYIMAADMRNGHVRAVLGSSQGQMEASNSRSRRSSDGQSSCSCRDTLDVAPVLAMSYKPQSGVTELFFVDKTSNTIYSTDLEGCNCFAIFRPKTAENLGFPPSLLAVDHMRLTWYNKNQGRLFSILKEIQNDRRLLIQDMADVKDIIGFGSHLQPLPDSECLQPGAYNSTVRGKIERSTSIGLLLSDPIRPEACKDISHARDKFTVYYRKAETSKLGASPEDCHDDRSQCSTAVTFTSEVELDNLEPYTRYLIQVAVSNYYTKDSEVLSESMYLTTKVGVPSPAREVNVSPLTPEMIKVQWQPPTRYNGPIDDVMYVVKLSTLTSEGQIQKERQLKADPPPEGNTITEYFGGLLADHQHEVTVLVCRANRTLCSAPAGAAGKTFMTPSNFTVLNVTPHSITFTWRSPPNDSILRHQVVYAEIKRGALLFENHGILSITEDDQLYREHVPGLSPNTAYAFRIKANYNGRPYYKALFMWPAGDEFIQKTPASMPNRPQPPKLTHLKSGGGYEVTWFEPVDNGEPITSYSLEYRNIEHTVWKEAYNGSIERWLVDTSRLTEGESYIFRVAALNSKGQGPFSSNSSALLAPYAGAESNSSTEIVIACTVAVVIFCIFIIIISCVLVTRKHREKVKPPQLLIRGPDTELATLRELPPHTTIEQNNTLYAISIQCTDEEIAKLPHFSRSQLVLTMFLGGGAFGEVYEGLARNILGDRSGETRCAVKTLRKSASENEKEEFLKEALLMKNFQHEHILGLLGVCLDNDPQFIIMELMEGGDLLSFLRSCRATSIQCVQLLLPDLVKVCVHVARGCKYLEDMHFVHRDLAARNCLVSTKNPKTMTVKIGDFGLARDIYKNDYYRKEGEGLLPVRWMSPESLVDGFFTTQSDIWAFGILMWEVVTLGQKPYPARNNIEVLHFVRDQGKPERPDNCADEMYQLMTECWSFNADDRPCFGSLLERLELFQDKCSEMTDLEISQLSPTAIDGGGSVRLTQSARQKRLNDLLGTSEAPEKLVVDLTKIGKKRHLSLEDSKNQATRVTGIRRSAASEDRGNNSRAGFPAAGDYDRNGYLEPRGAKGGDRYLELKNYAPELRHLRDPQGNPLISPSGSAFTPVHVTKRGYHPSHKRYTLVSPDEEHAEGSRQGSYDCGSDVCGVEDPNYLCQNNQRDANGLTDAGDEFPNDHAMGSSLYARTRYPAIESGYRRHFGDALYYKESSAPNSHDLKQQAAMLAASVNHTKREFSDQDLYSSTAPYRQRHPSSTSSTATNDHRYVSVECNNNLQSNGNTNNSIMNNINNNRICYSRETSSSRGSSSESGSGNGGPRNGSSGSYHNYSRPGDPRDPRVHEALINGVCAPTPVNSFPSNSNSPPSKSAAARVEGWAMRDLDDVFLDSTESLPACAAGVDYRLYRAQGQGHQNSGSRGQVHPEATPFTMMAYEGTNQVSLV